MAVCRVLDQGSVLLIWFGVLAAVVLLGWALTQLHQRIRQAVCVVVLVVGGLLGGASPALAVVPDPDACWWVPCWARDALWCPPCPD